MSGVWGWCETRPGAGHWTLRGKGIVRFEGDFPVGAAWLPPKGQQTVYVLFAGEESVYVGLSTNIRQRLKAHWHNRDAKPGIDSWMVWPHPTDHDMRSIESAMIRDRMPRYNVAGNPLYEFF